MYFREGKREMGKWGMKEMIGIKEKKRVLGKVGSV